MCLKVGDQFNDMKVEGTMQGAFDFIFWTKHFEELQFKIRETKKQMSGKSTEELIFLKEITKSGLRNGIRKYGARTMSLEIYVFFSKAIINNQ